jgi:hypothetical protein
MDVSEVRTVSITRAMMEAVRTSKMSANLNESTRRYIPESCHLHTHRHKNLKFRILISSFNGITKNYALTILCSFYNISQPRLILTQKYMADDFSFEIREEGRIKHVIAFD